MSAPNMWVFLVLGWLASFATGDAPVFSSIPITFVPVNSTYDYIVSASANPAPTFSISGAPGGISISASGVVSGTPNVTGSFDVDIIATNTDGSANQSFTLVVGSVPTLSGTPKLSATIGVSYSTTFVKSGFPEPTIAFSGPSWMLQSNDTTFSGTPTDTAVEQITVTATNQFGVATESWALNVVGVAPGVSGTPSTTAVVGSRYSATFSSSGTGPFTWSLSNAPSWLAINSTTGALSGTPDVGGSYPSVTVTATNSGGSSSYLFALTVNGVLPTIGGTPLTTANISIPYSFQITTSGRPAPTVSISGGPSWLSVSNNTVSGKPDATGSFPNVVLTASNSQGSSQLTFVLNVYGNVPYLAGGSLPTATKGVAYTYTIARSGVPLGTCSFVGLPTWLMANSSTCTLSGTPSTSGPFSFNVTQSNSQGTDTKSYKLYVRGVTTCSPPAAVVNMSYSYTCTSTSSPAPVFTLSGGPPGVTLSSSGVFSGTPTTTGRFPISVTISNSEEDFVRSTAFFVLANAAPVFITTPPSTAATNQLFSYEIQARGRPEDMNFSVVSGPSWLHIVDGNYLEGMPTNSDEGSIVVVIQASNGVNPNALQQFVLNVQQYNPVIKSVCPNMASAGVKYVCDLTTTGASPISFLIGTAPDWLSVEGCCTLTGTPNASDVGSSSIIITASNSYLPNDVQTFNIVVGASPTSMPTSAPTQRPSRAPTVSSAPAFGSSPPTSITSGSVYYYPVNVTGAPAPVISAAELPSWLRLSGNILTGSPPSGTAGTVTILLTASNGVGSDAKQSFVLVISNPPSAPRFLSSPKTTAAVGSPYSYPAVVATGTPTPNYTYSGPSFLSLVSSNGVVGLAGTPPVGFEGTYSIILVAANGVAPPDSQTFSLTVSPMVTPQPTFAPTVAPILARITSTPPQSASSGSPFVYVITGTGSPAPTFTVSGLPSWLSFTNGNTISGAPPAGMSGSSTFKVIGKQGGQPVVEQYVTIGINTNGNAPFITSSPPTTGALGSVYTYIIRATGSPAPVFLWTLPSWLTSTITPAGDIISGVPPAAGTYTIGVVASNGVSPVAYQSFNLTIAIVPTPAPTRAPTTTNSASASAPIIISAPPGTATTGQTFLYHVVVMGSPTPLISTTQLPSWLHLSGCCDITGTVPAQAIGSVTWTVSANNGVLPSASQTVTVNFQNPPEAKITSTPVTKTKAGALYQYIISAQGNPTPTITSNTLPSWLRLMGNILIGTPPKGTQGQIPITLRASNNIGTADEQTFSLTVEEQLSAPTINSLPPVRLLSNGSSFTYQISASGNPAPVLSPINVPSWLTLNGNTLSGTAPQEGGRYVVTIEATNNILPTSQQTFAIEIMSKPVLSLAGAPSTASVGYIYSYDIETTTSPLPTYTITDGNATWLAVNGKRVSGSPPKGTTGNACYSITATNSLGSDTATKCLQIVPAATCASTVQALVGELQVLLTNTRATCSPGVTTSYPNSTCHYQCDHPYVLRNDVTIGMSSGRRLMARMLLAISSGDQAAFDDSAASQWRLPSAQVHTMSTSSPSELEVFAIAANPYYSNPDAVISVPALSNLNGIPVLSFRQTSAAQSDMLSLITDMVPRRGPQLAQSSGETVRVTADTAWYAWLIVMLLIATIFCWCLFLFCLLCRKDKAEEETQKLRGGQSTVIQENYVSNSYRVGDRSLEDEEIRAARLELENYNRELEALQELHEEAKAEAARKEQAGQFEQAEVSRLLKQMVELEATQQQQHAAQVAALNSEIATLRARANNGPQDRSGDRLAQAQQHEELKRLSEEYQKLKSDRALLQADDLKNQKKLLDTVENLTRALEKSRADAEEIRNAIEEEKRRRIAAENSRFELEKQERALRERASREQERLLEEKARLLREQAERDRAKERDRAEKERLQRERERLEAERQRLASNRDLLEKDRQEKERLDAFAREREALEAERRRLEAERLRSEKERLEKDRLLAERAAVEKEKARLEASRLVEKQRLEKERLEKDKAALEAERARLAQERLKKEEESRKRELDNERTRLAQEKEKLARDRELLQRQHEERARSKSPMSPDPSSNYHFSDDSGIEDDSGGSGSEPQPLRFPKGPGLQDSDEDESGGSKFKTLSRAQGGVLEAWKQMERNANELKAKEKRRAARRLARRKARHEARREARLARSAAE